MTRDSYYIQNCNFRADEYSVRLDHVGHTYPDAPWKSDTHCHDNWEIHYITAGRGTLKTESNEYDITPGCMYITGPGFIHSQLADDDDPMEEYGIRLTLVRQKTVESALSRALQFLEECHFIFTVFDFDCTYPVSELIREYTQHNLASQERMQSLLLSLLILTARCINRAAVADPAVEEKNDRHEIIENYMRMYDKNININDLAAQLHLSQRQLRRILHDSYDSTLTQQKNRLRIESARQLLLTTDLSVAEVAQQTGFSSSAYFCRCFKKICGMSPLEYRKHAAVKNLIDPDTENDQLK